MSKDSVIHNKATFKKNVPITTKENVPLSELGHSTCRRKSIPKRKIEELAIEKYKARGEGIVFEDITSVFPCSKIKAQRILKDCCNKTGNNSRPLLFRSFKRTNPQQYFPSCIRADILEDLKKKENVLKHPTEVNHSSKSPLSNLHTQQKSQNFLDVLTNLPLAPLCIHKLQLQLSVNSESYDDFALFFKEKKEKSHIHLERIGKAQGIPNVTYIVYPKGKIMVFIACSDKPFKLETNNDLSSLFVFFGQVRDNQPAIENLADYIPFISNTVQIITTITCCKSQDRNLKLRHRRKLK